MESSSRSLRRVSAGCVILRANAARWKLPMVAKLTNAEMLSIVSFKLNYPVYQMHKCNHNIQIITLHHV